MFLRSLKKFATTIASRTISLRAVPCPGPNCPQPPSHMSKSHFKDSFLSSYFEEVEEIDDTRAIDWGERCY